MSEEEAVHGLVFSREGQEGETYGLYAQRKKRAKQYKDAGVRRKSRISDVKAVCNWNFSHVAGSGYDFVVGCFLKMLERAVVIRVVTRDTMKEGVLTCGWYDVVKRHGCWDDAALKNRRSLRAKAVSMGLHKTAQGAKNMMSRIKTRHDEFVSKVSCVLYGIGRNTMRRGRTQSGKTYNFPCTVSDCCNSRETEMDFDKLTKTHFAGFGTKLSRMCTNWKKIDILMCCESCIRTVDQEDPLKKRL